MGQDRKSSLERRPGDRGPISPRPARLARPLAMAAVNSLASGRAATARPDLRAWGVLTLLSFIYVLNFLDRQLLSILAKPIQDTLHISDGQLGLIGGLYFALFYC